MNIAIIGRTEILYQTAVQLHSLDYTIKLISTSKEAPEYKKTDQDFQALAQKLRCTYIYSEQLHKEANLGQIKKLGQIDIALSVNYPRILPKAVIDLFGHGILNAHAGDLPRYRGNACVPWALINGEKKIGLCIHKMVPHELDSGDIIARDYMDSHLTTKVGHVYQWMFERVPMLFHEALEKLKKNPAYILEKQSNKPTDTLRCYPRTAADGKIDWRKSNIEILRLINASSEPFQGAFCHYKNKKISIWDAEIYNDNENYCANHGQIAQIDYKTGSVIVITGNGKLKINEISYDKQRVKPAALIKSIRTRLGD